ncbi:MAG: hypothetical protein AABZ30_14975 [Myxococcota bacterium]
MARMKGFSAAVAGIALVSCNSPMIPLPPPAAQDVVVEAPEGMPGFLIFRGEPVDGRETTSFPAHAKVEIFNVDCDKGVIDRADGDGRFASDPVCGEIGDRFGLSYEDETGEPSETLCLIVRDGRQSALDECAGY